MSSSSAAAAARGGSAPAREAGALDLLPPPAARLPARLGPPYSRAEDVLLLPCGTLRDFLRCFFTDETGELRLVSTDARAHVGDHLWNDLASNICDTRRWRACFPRARGARLNENKR